MTPFDATPAGVPQWVDIVAASVYGHDMDHTTPEDMGWCHRYRCRTCQAPVVVPKREQDNGWGAATTEPCPVDLTRPRPAPQEPPNA